MNVYKNYYKRIYIKLQHIYITRASIFSRLLYFSLLYSLYFSSMKNKKHIFFLLNKQHIHVVSGLILVISNVWQQREKRIINSCGKHNTRISRLNLYMYFTPNLWYSFLIKISHTYLGKSNESKWKYFQY